MTDTTLFSAASALTGEQLIILYQLDLSPVGDPTVVFFTSIASDPLRAEIEHVESARVSFLGTEYEPINITATDFESSGTGALAQPSLKISNINMLLSGLLRDYDDLVGARINRIRTFSRFLDGHPNANLAATSFQWDTYIVEQKKAQNKFYVEFVLSSSIDQQGRMLPSRLALRDNCQWKYRVWNARAGSFDYSQVTCPYVGGNMYDTNGNQTGDPVQDRCSKHVATGCKPRYGSAVLPFGAFAGMTRTR